MVVVKKQEVGGAGIDDGLGAQVECRAAKGENAAAERDAAVLPGTLQREHGQQKGYGEVFVGLGAPLARVLRPTKRPLRLVSVT